VNPIYHHGPAEYAFFGTFGLWVVGERFLTLRDFRLGVRWGKTKDRGSVLWVVLGVAGGVGLGFVFAHGHLLRLPAPTVWVITGLIIAWAGIVFRFWAVRTLGRSFTTKVVVKEDQEVVTTGPYRLVRHPSYLGVIVILFGLGLAMSCGLSLLSMVVLPVAGLVPRIKIEEAAMRSGLGDRYEAYCRDHSRLIPGVW